MLHTKNESQEILNLLPKVKILYTQGESHETKPRLGQNKNKKSIFQACIWYSYSVTFFFFLLKTNIPKRVAKSRENKIDDPK